MKYRLMRQDDNGNVEVIKESESILELARTQAELEAKGHKQTYWCEGIKEEAKK
jgi:UDP-N-acetyl-2-amino-2-deoxyglucuronate dehydrogenase